MNAAEWSKKVDRVTNDPEKIERRKGLTPEIERLRTIEQNVLDLIAEKEEEYESLTEGAKVCLDNGWDEGYERLDHRLAEVHAQIYVLKKTLKG